MNIDPITVILFLIFFVAPLVNNFLRRGQGGSKGPQGDAQRGAGRDSRQGPQRQDSQRPSQGTQRSQERSNTTSNTGSATADTSRDAPSRSAGDEFTKRLEDARRRVQEAMSGEQRPTQSSETTQAERSGDLFSGSEEQPRPQPTSSKQGQSRQGGSQRGARRAFEGLGREGVGQTSSQASSQPSSQQGTMTKQAAVERTELGDAPPLRVQRLKGRKSAKVEQRGILAFDRRSVTQGIIWREILNEPLSKRKRKQRP